MPTHQNVRDNLAQNARPQARKSKSPMPKISQSKEGVHQIRPREMPSSEAEPIILSTYHVLYGLILLKKLVRSG